jgi:hypothetical protein
MLPPEPHGLRGLVSEPYIGHDKTIIDVHFAAAEAANHLED